MATQEAERPAREAEVLVVRVHARRVAAGIDHEHIHTGLMRDLRRLLGRSGASSLETRILLRVANRILNRLGRTETTDGQE